MKIKITNTDELVQALRDLETFERYNLYPDTVRRIREAIADYERANDEAHVTKIADGLSDVAKARLLYISKVNGKNTDFVFQELVSKRLEDAMVVKPTPLGLKVFAELQKPAPLPERWGVFGCGSGVAFCVCDSCNDIHIIADALRGHGYTVEVRKI